MTRYAGMDAKALRDTGTWKDIKSAIRCRHAVTSEETQKARLPPSLGIENPQKSEILGKSVDRKAARRKGQ